MRNFQNDGSEQYVVQNEFTAYLQTAVRRAKARYLSRQAAVRDNEISDSIILESGISLSKGNAAFYSLSNTVDFHQMDERLELTLLMTEMLAQLSEREVSILKGKIFDGLTFDELSARTGLDSNTIKSIYYRSLKKLRGLLED